MKKNLSIIKHLYKNIDWSLLNVKLIKKNSRTMCSIFKKIKVFWNNFITVHPVNAFNIDDIKNIVFDSSIGKNTHIINYMNLNTTMFKLSTENIDFYFFNPSDNKNILEKAMHLFKLTVVFKLYAINENFMFPKKTVVIWVPIPILRNFEYDVINDETLKMSVQKFNAFCPSGLTWPNQNDTCYTLLTRVEETTKLLLHELIHNYGIDGSKTNIDKNIVKEYNLVKNPLKTNINYVYPHAIFESITELFSSYFSIGFRLIDQNNNDFFENYVGSVIVELLYSYNLVSNLIKLNEFKSFEEFEKNKEFRANICVYEYCYLKSLAYNNYEIVPYDNDANYFNNIYKNMTDVAKINDPLLKNIFEHFLPTQNFRYCFYQ